MGIEHGPKCLDRRANPCPGQGEAGVAAGQAGLGTRCTSPNPAEPLTQTNKKAAGGGSAAEQLPV